jgi:peptide/nickel transport system substrate-binding protein
VGVLLKLKATAVVLVLCLAVIVPALGQLSQVPAAPHGHLIVAIPADAPPNLDPVDQASVTMATANIFEPLVTMNPKTYKMEPRLAESWRVVNPTTWEFNLRKGVKFHNGEPFTAEAVRFTIERSRSKGAGILVSSIDRVEVLNPQVVRLITKTPYPILDRTLIPLSIVPPKYVRENGPDALSKRPVGTGPFIFKERVRDSRTELERNKGYWGPPPAVERITFRTIPDATARVAALLAGEVNVVTHLEPSHVTAVERGNKTSVVSRRSPRRMYVMMRTDQDGPLADKLVRQAMNYAVDKRAIAAQIFGGRAQPIAANLVPEEFGHDASLRPYPYLPDYARQLLTQAGYPNGFSVTFETSAGRYLLDKEGAEAIVGYLEAVGVKVELKVNESGAHLRKYRTRTVAGMFQWAYFLPTFDGVSFMEFLYSTSDRSYFRNAEFDRLTEVAQRTMDPRARQQALHKLQRIVRDEAPYIFLYQLPDIYGVSSTVTGFDPPPIVDLFNLTSVGVK